MNKSATSLSRIRTANIAFRLLDRKLFFNAFEEKKIARSERVYQSQRSRLVIALSLSLYKTPYDSQKPPLKAKLMAADLSWPNTNTISYCSQDYNLVRTTT